ncbi:MAG: YihY/virulence factor BrkB family protein [Thermomicrobiales bacterium]|nr:YihY/virulence factor BrkB family protein [Thermomicrobiales bacterium]
MTTASGEAPAASREQPSGLNRVMASLKQRHATLKAASAPYAIMAEIVHSFQQHDPSLLARQSAYSLLYAVPSLLIMLVSLAAIVDQNTGASVSGPLREFISTEAPKELQPLLDSLVEYALVETSQHSAVVAALIALAIAIWGAAGGVGAMIYSINTVYGIRDTRSFLKGAVIRVGLTLLGGIMMIVAFILLALGQILIDELPDLGLDIGVVYGFLSSGPVVALFLLFGSLLLLYWIGLDCPCVIKWLIPGATLASLAIGLLVILMDRILTFTNPGAAYGVAGSVLILLWSLYMASQIAVIGAIVNAVLGQRYDRKLIAALSRRRAALATRNEIAVSVYH